MNENQFLPVPTKSETPDLMLPPEQVAEEPPPPLRKLVLAMRGRWRLAIILAAVLGCTLGALGVLIPRPKYKSTGIIRVDPYLDRVMFPNEEKSLRSYDTFVGSLVSLIRAQRIVDLALAHPSWTKLQRANVDQTKAEFYKNLEVEHPRSTELILVSFTDTDPYAAEMAVKSVVDSYSAVYIEGEYKKAAERIDAIEGRRSKLREEQKRLRDNKVAIATEAGVDDLKARQIQLNEEIRSFEARLHEIEMAIRLLRAARGEDPNKDLGALIEEETPAPGLAVPLKPKPDSGEPGVKKITDYELTPEIAATLDPKMRDLLSHRDAIQREIKQLSLTLGDGHRNLVYAKTLLANIELQIEDRMKFVLDQIAKGFINTNISGTGPSPMSLKDLMARYSATRRMYDEVHKKLREINIKLQAYQRIADEEEVNAQNLKETNRRLDELSTELPVANRVKVLSSGDKPVEPFSDSRKVLGIAGLVVGLFIGFAFMLLVGLSDRRIRNVDEAEDSFSEVPMLGVLPTLPEDLSAPDQAAIAAHCVHQIRTLLQISADSQGRRVFATTSALRGDGKTSLSLALGLSFATSEAKTLLIDCDLAGSGLTRRVDAIIRRKVGDILQRKQLVTAQQVDHALQLAQESGRRLGETLVELGYVDQAALDEALSLQEHTPVGLLDALAGEPLEHCVAPTGVENLWILGVGAADGNHVARLSPLSLRRVLDECRREFDVVVIDTGPMPGSLEASHVAAEVDGVVMVISRNEERGQVEKALEHLAAIGARVAGVVFNRADGRDVQALAYSSMVSQWPHDRPPNPPNPTKESARFGPVARAVASTVPPSASRTNQ